MMTLLFFHDLTYAQEIVTFSNDLYPSFTVVLELIFVNKKFCWSFGSLVIRNGENKICFDLIYANLIWSHGESIND